jgi:uncharacterized RDD family membrane protein YckC
MLDSLVIGIIGLVIGGAMFFAMVSEPGSLFVERPDGTLQWRPGAEDEVDGAVFAITVVMSAMAAVYFVGFHAMSGQTPGKGMLGIKVVDVHTGEAPNIGTSILRYVIYAGPGLAGFAMSAAGPPLESFAFAMNIATLAIIGWILFEKTRRGLHDIIAETAVVRTRPPAREMHEPAAATRSGW